jgi:predicted nucleotidyltransferase
MKVRLTEEQVNAIKDAVRTVVGEDARIFVFGSRTDLSKKGGDIDLLVKVSRMLSDDERFEMKRRVFVELCKRLGERKIDLLVTDEPRSSIERVAMEEGVEI